MMTRIVGIGITIDTMMRKGIMMTKKGATGIMMPGMSGKVKMMKK
jgi:hypothetical protein